MVHVFAWQEEACNSDADQDLETHMQQYAEKGSLLQPGQADSFPDLLGGHNTSKQSGGL